MALRLAVAMGTTPIGAPIVGWVANRFGPRWALGIGAAAGFAAAIVALYVMGRWAAAGGSWEGQSAVIEVSRERNAESG